MLFKMPYGKSLEIRPSKVLDEDLPEIGIDEEIKGLHWIVYLGDEASPLCFETRQRAYCYALGAQWGAYQVYDNLPQRIK
jgi:hypothetical protein